MTNIYNPNWYETNTLNTEPVAIEHDVNRNWLLWHKLKIEVVVMPKPPLGYHYELVKDTPDAI
jgi:hypothetical protein